LDNSIDPTYRLLRDKHVIFDEAEVIEDDDSTKTQFAWERSGAGQAAWGSPQSSQASGAPQHY
jgi:hypothetical protein